MNPKTITVVVRFFASAKDLARASELTVKLPEGSVAADALAAAVSHHPDLKALASFTRIAVNESYAGLDVALADNDEVAILPPVSGG